MPSSKRGLQGPRPHPLQISGASRKSNYKPPQILPAASAIARVVAGADQFSSVLSGGSRSSQAPVIVYLESPKIIHARPQEFMSLVQRLTGKDSCIESPRSPASFVAEGSSGESAGGREAEGKREEAAAAEEDPLLLTLGLSPSAAAWASVHGASMVSPGSLFSPGSRACLQEFDPFF
ncbi:Protein MKS1 [Apostasia shenzhenica]|uniref:Protein MKS1 n=1 Tax=Apostasia shenzhenica TaxID=1088818 RepID=A0A2H9ZRA1_9ASPA|nr:Protein MKS1 [Apostasia shenzhenica]